MKDHIKVWFQYQEENREIFMKKKLISLVIFVLCIQFSFSESFHFVAEKDVIGIYYGKNAEEYLDYQNIIKKGTFIDLDPAVSKIVLSTVETYGYDDPLAVVNESDKYKGNITIKNLKIKDCPVTLPESIISIEETGFSKKFVPVFFLEALFNKDTARIKKYDPTYKLENNFSEVQEANEENIAWNLEVKWLYPVISNIGIRFHNENSFLFKKIEKISENQYRCIGQGFPSYTIDLMDESYWESYFKYDKIESGKYESLILTIDGDYVDIYSETQKKQLITYVIISESIDNQLKNLFHHKNSNLENLKWPHHADGSCDYEPTQKTLFTLESIMTVKENLKLRSEEATSSEVLTVMSEGAKVQILEIGKSDIIGGIKSNWVKVKIQKGSRDTQGRLIIPGVVGWCYGGYLE